MGRRPLLVMFWSRLSKGSWKDCGKYKFLGSKAWGSKWRQNVVTSQASVSPHIAQAC